MFKKISMNNSVVFETSFCTKQRNSRPEMFCREGVLKNFTKFTGKYLSWGLFFSKVEGALSGLSQFVASESPLKMMKNVFYFTLKALLVLKIFKFLS